MTAEPITDNPVCSVCRGHKSEHFDADGKPITRHAFTEREGELVTHEQQKKQQQAQNPLAPTVVRLPGAQTNELTTLQRLIEVLMDKKLIDGPEALYIAGYVSEKPQQPSGFQDPVYRAGGDG